jgi:two-component system, OmpR family, KDP operon response regulator KdpE
MATALIVDTDPHAMRDLRVALTERGYDVVLARDAVSTIRLTDRSKPDIVVVEHRLPDMPGRDVIVALRDMTAAAIVVVSDCADTEEMVCALDAGADGFLLKPFGVDEFLARVRAALRRSNPASPGRRALVDAGSFSVDLAARKVWRDGLQVRLTRTEWSLLEVLIRHEGNLVSHGHLLMTVRGPGHHTDTHYLRVYMGQLRRKLEPFPGHPRHLITEPDQGYRFNGRRTDSSAVT